MPLYIQEIELALKRNTSVTNEIANIDIYNYTVFLISLK